MGGTLLLLFNQPTTSSAVTYYTFPLPYFTWFEPDVFTIAAVPTTFAASVTATTYAAYVVPKSTDQYDTTVTAV